MDQDTVQLTIMNLSSFSDQSTARTHHVCAAQRAYRVSQSQARSVLELCVGPSLKTLSAEYALYGVECWGNDIDPRWARYYPGGKWLLGDVFEVFRQQCQLFDTVVFAPPLSEKCSGTRGDSLSILDVRPGYREFVDLVREVQYTGVTILTLPGRCLSTRQDRSQFHQLLAFLWDLSPEVHPIIHGCRKYVDIHLQ